MKSLLDQKYDTPEKKRDFLREVIRMEVSGHILDAMNKSKISRKELAVKLGVSSKYVKQLLDGDINISIECLSDIMFALGHRIRMEPFQSEGDKL